MEVNVTDRQVIKFCATCQIGDSTFEIQRERVRHILENEIPGGIVRAIIADELGKKLETPHLQIFCRLNKKIFWPKLQKILVGCHFIDLLKGTDYQNFEYCRKEHRTIIELGEPPVKPNGSGVDYQTVIKHSRNRYMRLLEDDYAKIFFHNRGNIDKLGLEGIPPPEFPVRAFWLMGSPGTGKSRFGHHFWPKDTMFIKDPNKWWDGLTAKHRCVVMDDVDHNNFETLCWFLKVWADRYRRRGETKGGYVWLEHKIFIVTSNYRIETLCKQDMELVGALKRRFKEVVVLDHRENPLGQVEILTPDPKNHMLTVWLNNVNIMEESFEDSDDLICPVTTTYTI